jgi:ribonucleotide monophosphatase NagD (HAD superfamily)
MICANPDLVVERGSRLIWCAGSIAERYEAMGGRVTWTGKPHRAVYDAAFEIAALTRGAPVAPERALAIGDAIRTDIAGARAVGVRSLMIAAGIHAHELLGAQGEIGAAKADHFFAAAQARPDALMARLRW